MTQNTTKQMTQYKTTQGVYFALGEHFFALPLPCVKEIAPLQAVRVLPQENTGAYLQAEHIKEYFFYQDEILPLVDFYAMLKIEPNQEQNNILICTLDTVKLGISIDAQIDICDLGKEQALPKDDIFFTSPYIMGHIYDDFNRIVYIINKKALGV